MFYFSLFYNIRNDMTGERDPRGSNQMTNNSQHWTSSEDNLLLGRNA